MTMRPADFFAGVVFAVFAVMLGAVHPLLIGFPVVGAVLWVTCRRLPERPSSEEAEIEEWRRM